MLAIPISPVQNTALGKSRDSLLRAFLHEEVHEATRSQIGPQEGELAMVAQRASGELEEVEVKLRAALRAAGAAP